MADHLSDLTGAIPASTQQLLQAALADLAVVRQELQQEIEARAQAEQMITKLLAALASEQERREMAELEARQVHEAVSEQLAIAEAEHEADQRAWREVLRPQQKCEEERQLEVLVLNEQLRSGSDTRRRLEKQLGGRRYAVIERLVPMDDDSDTEAVGEMLSERLEYTSSSLLQR
jgi:hypothetical protein